MFPECLTEAYSTANPVQAVSLIDLDEHMEKLEPTADGQDSTPAPKCLMHNAALSFHHLDFACVACFSCCQHFMLSTFVSYSYCFFMFLLYTSNILI